MKRIALYAGSFDPFTRGHADIVSRGLDLFDEVIVAIGTNEAKRNLYTAEQRQQQISRYYADEPRVRIIVYTGLTVTLAQELGAHVLLRGVRSSTDMARLTAPDPYQLLRRPRAPTLRSRRLGLPPRGLRP